MLYDFVIWAGRRWRYRVVSGHRRHASSVRVAWPIPIGRPSRRAGAPGCPPASRYDLTRRLSYRGRTRARGLVRPSPRASRPGTRRGPRWLPRARRDAHERRILAPPRLPGSRATAPRPVSTPRPRRGYGAYGRPGERDGGGCGSASVFIDLSVHAIAVAAV